MFKNTLAATAVALSFALPAAARPTLNDYIPAAADTGKSVYVVDGSAPVVVTFFGADAGNYNIAYFVRSLDDQFLFFNKVDVVGKTATLTGPFADGAKIVFSLNSVGSEPATFLTGTEYARAGMTDYGFVVAFEDTVGGDGDYNDMVFGVSNVTNELPPVPVPAALPLLASAFGGLAFLRRRKA